MSFHVALLQTVLVLGTSPSASYTPAPPPSFRLSLVYLPAQLLLCRGKSADGVLTFSSRPGETRPACWLTSFLWLLRNYFLASLLPPEQIGAFLGGRGRERGMKKVALLREGTWST